MSVAADERVRHVVILVHGTFARNADWTRPGSHLRRCLKASLDQVRFFRFEWSGHNTLAARQRAAIQLWRRLVVLKRRYPAAKQIVIAHSHGGNIALYALRGHSHKLPNLRLVCLATPFVWQKQRRWGTSGADSAWVGIGALIAFGGLLAGERVHLAGAAALLVAAGLILTLAASVAIRRQVTLWRRQLEIPTDLDPRKILTLYAPGDEAFTGLSLGEVLSERPIDLWRRLHNSLARRTRLRWSFPADILSALLFPPLAALVLLSSLAFGWDAAPLSPGLHLRAERTPQGYRDLRPPALEVDESDEEGSILVHARLYEHPRALAQIRNWLCDTEGLP